ncbi:MAG: type II toxin-antitoxin system Phd/YefM family antitoxin [Gammaproteobacteria bacterium]
MAIIIYLRPHQEHTFDYLSARIDRLSQCLRRAQAGEEITVTSHGKPAARLTPPRAGIQRCKISRASANPRPEGNN